MRDLQEPRRNLLRLGQGFLWAYAFMAVWLAYWHVVRAPALNADPHNPRATERLKITQPGKVLTSDGKVIVEGARSEFEWYLAYPGHEAFCHLTGYNSETGLQKPLRDALYGQGVYEDPWSRLLRGRRTGCDVTLTINARAQARAAQLMSGARGAVVALDPRTGGILVLVSAPSYEPGGVVTSREDFAAFQRNREKPELNRALLGQYAPGSVLKILTAAAALDAAVVRPTDLFVCKGQTKISGATIVCRLPKGHGNLDFNYAFQDSCNVVFAEVGSRLGPQRFQDYVRRFMLLQAPELPLPSAGGRMAAMNGPAAVAEVAEAAFGQGATMVSPVAIARLAATIANRGVVPKLQLVQRIVGPDGRVYQELKPETLNPAVSAATAQTVAGMMVNVVERGTGRQAAISGVRVAGKTGSAENPSGLPHAWFAGFAPADDPRVVVAVIVENGGSGGGSAAPIAREVMKVLLGRE